MKTSPYLRHAERMGRKGDKHLVHVNDRELGLLKMAGGAGTRNPKTGLLEFYGESRDRQDTTGGGSHDVHGSAGAGATSDKRGPNQRSGLVYTGEDTTYGAPVKVGRLGVKTALPENATPGKPAQSWGSWKDQVGAYNKAATEWNQGTGLSVGNFVNQLAPMGFSMQAPDLNRPGTYTGGTYHVGVNPVGAAVGAGTLAAGIPGPWGSVAGKIYNDLGFHDLVLGGPDVPGGWDKNGASPADTSGSSVGGASPSGGSTGNGGNGLNHLQQLAQINQPVSGNPSAPQPVGPTGTPPVTPTGPDYKQIMASIQQITPGYGVQLPGYQYGRKATV